MGADRFNRLFVSRYHKHPVRHPVGILYEHTWGCSFLRLVKPQEREDVSHADKSQCTYIHTRNAIAAGIAFNQRYQENKYMRLEVPVVMNGRSVFLLLYAHQISGSQVWK